MASHESLEGSAAPPPPRSPNELTLQHFLKYLWPLIDSVPMPRWPPDVFGLVASALKKSGAYESIVSEWPPSKHSGDEWLTFVATTAEQWRSAWETGAPLPEAVISRWETILRANVALRLVRDHKEVRDALLELSAISDETCFGVGIPGAISGKVPPFEQYGSERLSVSSRSGSSLCEVLHPSRVIVLPKLHTPRGGISIRSLSHNLAVCDPGEVSPIWTTVPSSPNSRSLNLLLVPWPYHVTPAQFNPCDAALKLETMPDCYGFFQYEPAGETSEIVQTVEGLLDTAKKLVGRIDGVVLPELALTHSQYEALSPNVLRHQAFLLSGVWEPGGTAQPGKNCLAFDLPVYYAPSTAYVPIRQSKHHRWCLDKPQVVQYGLGGRLDPMRSWWEHSAVERRKLTFVAMRPWLTLSALICEDLARRDPVDDVMRSVGPNLVISLLMDGPQLATRWPARYATVLADDPGSSVLTLTNLGMTTLCRPPGKSPSRSVGLWKDSRSAGPVELELAEGCGGLVLSLAIEMCEEWSADGRTDGRSTGYPFLAGVHPVPL
jgi:hypothetical protein